jgi:hypothetical protein
MEQAGDSFLQALPPANGREKRQPSLSPALSELPEAVRTGFSHPSGLSAQPVAPISASAASQPLPPITLPLMAQIEQPRETPRPTRINRELARLQSHNEPGASEEPVATGRTQQTPSQYSVNVVMSENEPSEQFNYHFDNFVAPDWNGALHCF